MTFTKTCFIRKNTPELRNKLKELGYELSERVSDDNELCLATGMDKFTTIKNSGEKVISNDWWYQGEIPECFRDIMPDNAKWDNNK